MKGKPIKPRYAYTLTGERPSDCQEVTRAGALQWVAKGWNEPLTVLREAEEAAATALNHEWSIVGQFRALTVRQFTD
jgi:hypothetical protein